MVITLIDHAIPNLMERTLNGGILKKDVSVGVIPKWDIEIGKVFLGGYPKLVDELSYNTAYTGHLKSWSINVGIIYDVS